MPSHPGKHSGRVDWSGLRLLAADVSLWCLCITVNCAFYKVPPTNSFVEYMHSRIIWLSGYLTLLTRHSWWNSLPERRLTYSLPSEPCGLNLDSTENITLFCASNHLTCFWPTTVGVHHLLAEQWLVVGPSCWPSATEQASVDSSVTDLHIRRLFPCTPQVYRWFPSLFKLIRIRMLSAEAIVARLPPLPLTRSTLPVLACVCNNLTGVHWLRLTLTATFLELMFFPCSE